MLQVELAIKITLDFGSVNSDFQILPLPAGGGRIADPLYALALALFVFEQHEIVFEGVGSDEEVIAIRL